MLAGGNASEPAHDPLTMRLQDQAGILCAGFTARLSHEAFQLEAIKLVGRACSQIAGLIPYDPCAGRAIDPRHRQPSPYRSRRAKPDSADRSRSP